MRTVRLDNDVWAECQRLGKEHGTINEGLRDRLFRTPDIEYNPQIPRVPKVDKLNLQDVKEAHRVMRRKGESQEVRHARKVLMQKRSLRPKGDKTR